MTASPIELATSPADGSLRNDPFRNPSYPVRDHFLERAKFEAALRSCEERLARARQTLDSLASDQRPAIVTRLYHQLQGARDQIAETVRRMPLETGDLYHEDKERFEQAVAAFERTWRRWESFDLSKIQN